MVGPTPTVINTTDDITNECARNLSQESTHSLPAGTEMYTVQKTAGKVSCSVHVEVVDVISAILNDSDWKDAKIGSSWQLAYPDGKITLIRKI